MAKQYYAFSSGEYSDYRVGAFMLGNEGADFQALFDEFAEIYYKVSPLFPEPRPEPTRGNWRYNDEELVYFQKLNDYNKAQVADWNARGYEGYDIKDFFLSWLVKDKGFELIEYYEINTDYDIREKQHDIE